MQKTIFIVDDNVSNLAKAEETLEKEYLVITLTSAVKMLVVMEKIIPDLILLDIEMPDMNGLEAIKILKANENYKDIPVMFLTGLTDADTEAYGIELGAVDFITKPFSEPVLLNRTKYHLQIGDILREQSNKFDVLKQELTDMLRIIAENEKAPSGFDAADVFKKIKKQLESMKGMLMDYE